MIYFIREKDSGNIKIGFSINPEKRKTNLQTGNSEKLEVIGLMSGTFYSEAQIKEKFSQFWIRGEWFHPDQEILNFVEKYTVKPNINLVGSIGGGEYRITFAQPFGFTLDFVILSGTHKLRVMCDSDLVFVLGIEGKREILLDWLEGLPGITEKAFKEFEQSMTDD